MKYGTSFLLLYAVLLNLSGSAHAELRDKVLRDAALRNGFAEPAALVAPVDEGKSEAGQILFEDTRLSLNGDTSCKTCHLDRFSSADGLPNAVGVGGSGEGLTRLRSGGAVIPRNTLPLWGRGSKGFGTFFWDGKVEENSGEITSQFGTDAPSSDPLTVAVHLPFVEIREMVVDDDEVVREYQKEEVAGAQKIYAILEERIRNDSAVAARLMDAYGVKHDELRFIHIAESITHFIRDRFRLRETRFHRFLFKGEPLSPQEREGGLIFYGKGRCVLCHSGSYLSDFRFHTIPFPQAGFGKNGFGIDYGRYNVTFDDRDLYKFRTPPLFNVAETGPYSHSGAVASLQDAVTYHFDPLRFFDPSEHDVISRTEFYKRLSMWSGNELRVPTLSGEEVSDVVAFLKTLSFEMPVR